MKQTTHYAEPFFGSFDGKLQWFFGTAVINFQQITFVQKQLKKWTILLLGYSLSKMSHFVLKHSVVVHSAIVNIKQGQKLKLEVLVS